MLLSNPRCSLTVGCCWNKFSLISAELYMIIMKEICGNSINNSSSIKFGSILI